MLTRLAVVNVLSYFLILAFSGGEIYAQGIENNGGPVKGRIKEYGENLFPGEVPPPESVDCFPGAYYRKVVTSEDYWLGIKGKVSLPEIHFDPGRKDPDHSLQFLDNPSIYIGGNSDGQETDLGLTWEVIRDKEGNVTSERLAFRPFLRRTGYDQTGQEAVYENAPAKPNYYWYPGDEVEMSLKIVDDGVLCFTVEGEGKKFQKNFASDGYRKGKPAEFKRVNAIDQVGNEGKEVSSSETRLGSSKWEYTFLWRLYDGEELLVPMHRGRYTGMKCPDAKYFEIKRNEVEAFKGGEKIIIDAGRD